MAASCLRLTMGSLPPPCPVPAAATVALGVDDHREQRPRGDHGAELTAGSPTEVHSPASEVSPPTPVSRPCVLHARLVLRAAARH